MINLLESRTESSQELGRSACQCLHSKTLFPVRSSTYKTQTQPFTNVPDKFSTSGNNLISELQCMIIGSFGDKHVEGIKCSPKEKRPLTGGPAVTQNFLPGVRRDVERLQDMIRKDKDKELVYSLMDIPGVQETKQFYINYIKKLFKECSKKGALIYYTGHGEFGTGNWCIKDGTISLQEIIAMYFDYFRGKLLYVFTDCCYSGHWVVELAKYLDDLGIGACGHQTREQGLLFKIVASCEPDQKAADGCFSSGALGFDNIDKNITFATRRKLSESQNVYGCDFTHTMCYQLKGPTAPCRLPEMPARYQWHWKDIVSTMSNPGERTFVVRGRDRGRTAWNFVVIPACLVETFKVAAAIGTVDVSNYGFSVASGFGDDPPNSVHKELIKFAPSYYNYTY